MRLSLAAHTDESSGKGGFVFKLVANVIIGYNGSIQCTPYFLPCIPVGGITEAQLFSLNGCPQPYFSLFQPDIFR